MTTTTPTTTAAPAAASAPADAPADALGPYECALLSYVRTHGPVPANERVLRRALVKEPRRALASLRALEARRLVRRTEAGEPCDGYRLTPEGGRALLAAEGRAPAAGAA